MSWIDEATVTTAEDKAAQALEREKDQIIADFEAESLAIVAGYPERERETFHKQLQEAQAIVDATGEPTPFLDAVCLQTGDDKLTKAQDILANDAAYSAAVGDALGKMKKRLKGLA